jgi:hypothetical protein
MITLRIEGQSLELPENIAVNDDAVRRAIAPLFPQIASARFERVTDKDGRTELKVTKEAGVKGLTPETLVDTLKRCPRHINPALALSHKLQQANINQIEDILTLERQVEAAIQKGEYELKVTNAIFTRLLHAPAVPSSKTPLGF